MMDFVRSANRHTSKSKIARLAVLAFCFAPNSIWSQSLPSDGSLSQPRYSVETNSHIIPFRDSVISSINLAIQAASIRQNVQYLQDFGTRYAYAPNRDSVAKWIAEQYRSIGYTDVSIDSTFRRGIWHKTVIATLRGRITPERVLVIGGHWDSTVGYVTNGVRYGDPLLSAPGADDNGSGTASVLEIARAVKQIGFRPEATVKFIAFAGEEVGFIGSSDFVAKAISTKMDIRLMINLDVIAYPEAGAWSMVRITSPDTSASHVVEAVDVTRKFTLLSPKLIKDGGAGDHWPFIEVGVPVLNFWEGSSRFSPYLHTTDDVVSKYDWQYCAEIAKAACAVLVNAAGDPMRIRSLCAVDRGDGQSILLRWRHTEYSETRGYRVYWGKSSGEYEASVTTSDTCLVLDNLIQGLSYFIAVSSLDSSGIEGATTEVTAIPRQIPLPPSHLTDEPQPRSVRLKWNRNAEFDVMGYNVYRSTDPSQAPAIMNPQIIVDTRYIDSTAVKGPYYYYAVTAVDSMRNESPPSLVRSRVVSMDNGILIVNDSYEGNGVPLNPTSAQVDSFYRDLLSAYSAKVYDLAKERRVKFADLCAFSTILWQNNASAEYFPRYDAVEAIRTYLQAGGKILISCLRPSTVFGDTLPGFRSFGSGDFLYDCLKISRGGYSPSARFRGAISASSSYPTMRLDSNKAIQVYGDQLLPIETAFAAPGAEPIYFYDSGLDRSSPEGVQNGSPTGIEYLGSDFKMILVTFPLFCMDNNASKSFVRHVLTTKFLEQITNVQLSSPRDDSFVLFQNYPNPFNPSTTITFYLPEQRDVTVNIYNALGQLITTLVAERMELGYHSVTWAGEAPSGIYFYRVQAGGFQQTKKMILVR